MYSGMYKIEIWRYFKYKLQNLELSANRITPTNVKQLKSKTKSEELFEN